VPDRLLMYIRQIQYRPGRAGGSNRRSSRQLAPTCRDPTGLARCAPSVACLDSSDSGRQVIHRPVGLSDRMVLHQQDAGDLPWGEVRDLWGEAMRLQVIPWGEAIKNY
jgi:hypothetical protein